MAATTSTHVHRSLQDVGDGDMSEHDAALLRASKLSMLALVGFLTLVGSLSPWCLTRAFKQRAMDVMNILIAAAAGVILGAFLCHMVPDVSASFSSYMHAQYGPDDKRTSYPWGMMIIGATFLLLVVADRVVLHAGLAGADDHHGHRHDHKQEEHDHISASIEELRRIKELEAAARAAQREAALSATSSTDLHVSSPPTLPYQPPAPDTMLSPPSATETRPVASAQALGTEAAGVTGHASAAAPVAAPAVHSDGREAVNTTNASGDGLAISINSPISDGGIDKPARARAWIFVLALSLHAVFDGLALGAEDTLSGFYSILVAVLAHKVFDGIAAGAAVYPARLPFGYAFGLVALCAAMTPLGIAIGYASTASANSQSTELASAILVSLSAGSFLFISLAELLPACLHDGRLVRPKLAVCFLGWAAMAILAAFV